MYTYREEHSYLRSRVDCWLEISCKLLSEPSGTKNLISIQSLGRISLPVNFVVLKLSTLISCIKLLVSRINYFDDFLFNLFLVKSIQARNVARYVSANLQKRSLICEKTCFYFSFKRLCFLSF